MVGDEPVRPPAMGEVIAAAGVTHAPVVTLHAVAGGLGQSVACVATPHARHMRVVVSQMGVAPEQSALVVQPPLGTLNETGVPVGPTVVPGPTLAAVTVCMPGERGEVGVNEKLPEGSVIAVPAGVPSMMTCTVLLAGPVPRTVGVFVGVVLPIVGLVIVGGEVTH